MKKIANLQRLGQYMALTWTDKKKTLFVQTPAGLWLPQSQPGGGDGPGPEPEPGEGGWHHPLGDAYPTGTWTTYEDGGGSHSGGAVDIPTGPGSELPLYAPCDGEVIYASWENGGGGNVIIIRPVGETAGVTLAHLNEISVSVGQTVAGGTLIGKQGWTGTVIPPGPAGAHLHVEVRVNGTQWGPWHPAVSYFAARGVTL